MYVLHPAKKLILVIDVQDETYFKLKFIKYQILSEGFQASFIHDVMAAITKWKIEKIQIEYRNICL